MKSLVLLYVTLAILLVSNGVAVWALRHTRLVAAEAVERWHDLEEQLKPLHDQECECRCRPMNGPERT